MLHNQVSGAHWKLLKMCLYLSLCFNFIFNAKSWHFYVTKSIMFYTFSIWTVELNLYVEEILFFGKNISAATIYIPTRIVLQLLKRISNRHPRKWFNTITSVWTTVSGSDSKYFLLAWIFTNFLHQHPHKFHSALQQTITG